MLVLLKDEETGETIGRLLANDKTFASGNRGYFGTSKLEPDGKRYQCQFQAVEIGSKDKANNGK